MVDGERNPGNPVDLYLRAESSVAEATFVNQDLLSNGSKLITSTGEWNSAHEFIYLALLDGPMGADNLPPMNAR